MESHLLLFGYAAAVGLAWLLLVRAVPTSRPCTLDIPQLTNHHCSPSTEYSNPPFVAFLVLFRPTLLGYL